VDTEGTPLLVADPAVFAHHFALVQAYVRREPGSYTQLMTVAEQDPAGMTTSVLALGAVLLDIAAGAFKLTPEEMLDKLMVSVSDHSAAALDQESQPG